MTNQDNMQEQDMRQVFDNALSAISTLRDRVITSVASHSNQARELDDLKNRFGELSDRMNTVVQEAQRFRQDLHLTMVERDKYKKDAEDNLALANSYEQERNAERGRVHELTTAHDNLSLNLEEANRKLEAANQSIARLGSDLDWLRKSSADLRELHSNEVDQRIKSEKELKAATERLNKLQGLMRELFPETTAVPAEDKPSMSQQLYPTRINENVGNPVYEVPGEAPKFDPPPVQSAGVNERIDDQDYAREGEKPSEEKPLPWWEKDKAAF